MSYGVLVDDVLLRTVAMNGSVLVLQQRGMLLAISDSKNFVHVVEFEEGVEEIEHENLVEERHTASFREGEIRCCLQIVQLGKLFRRNSIKLMGTPTKSTQLQQRISDTQKADHQIS